MKKSAFLTLLIMILVFFSLVLGALFQKYKPYPYNFLKNYLIGESSTSYGSNCPTTYDIKLYRTQEISMSNLKIPKIFWGDSLVDDMHDSRFYGVNEFQEIGYGSQIIYCALQEIQTLINFSPQTVLLYIGGNDADGLSWYGPEQAALYYGEMIEILLNNNITPIIHLIHEASLKRDRDYVHKYNELLKELAIQKNLQVIPGLNELSFDVSSNNVSNNIDYLCKTNECSIYSYDGEHLKHQGYKIWIDHIKKHIPNF